MSMRRISIDAIQGNEILAKAVYTNMDTILMPEGVQLRKDYISRLRSLNIEYIYVEDEISKGVETTEITEMKIKEECKEILDDTWERISCNSVKSLAEIKEVTNYIIEDMLEQPEIMFCISGVRNKSEMLYSHTLNVCAMSVFLAVRMKLSKKVIREIAEGSILHDIGFMKIPDEIREKTEKEMNTAERKELFLHPVYGYDYIEKEKWITKGVKEIVLYHHENLDGTGYPFQRTEDKISIGCRIVNICDTFDRMVYGIFEKRRKVHEAIEYIMAEAGHAFDKKIAMVFNKSVVAYPNGTLVRTNEGEVGIVLRQNENFPARPVIRMIRDENGKDYKEWTEKNLVKELTLFIQDTIE